MDKLNTLLLPLAKTYIGEIPLTIRDLIFIINQSERLEQIVEKSTSRKNPGAYIETQIQKIKHETFEHFKK